MKQIIIEKDGWVYIKDGKLEQGLGDIGVDVEIVDKRKTEVKLTEIEKMVENLVGEIDKELTTREIESGNLAPWLGHQLTLLYRVRDNLLLILDKNKGDEV